MSSLAVYSLLMPQTRCSSIQEMEATHSVTSESKQQERSSVHRAWKFTTLALMYDTIYCILMSPSSCSTHIHTLLVNGNLVELTGKHRRLAEFRLLSDENELRRMGTC
jgi:hypothetical protein